MPPGARMTSPVTRAEVEAAVAEVNRQFALVRVRAAARRDEFARVEALRQSRVIPHERGEE